MVTISIKKSYDEKFRMQQKGLLKIFCEQTTNNREKFDIFNISSYPRGDPSMKLKIMVITGVSFAARAHNKPAKTCQPILKHRLFHIQILINIISTSFALSYESLKKSHYSKSSLSNKGCKTGLRPFQL